MKHKLDFNKTYRNWSKKHKQTHKNKAVAMEQAIGGEFAAMGQMQRDLLIQLGLGPDDYVIDAGCGSGRLAVQLTNYLTRGKFMGFDVVPDFIAHAKSIAKSKNFTFEVSKGTSIPEADGQADFVVFFSVFTHLLHEESYRYLQEASRVLKPGAMVVFSFLEFAMPNHWAVFELNVDNLASGNERHLDMFMSRDGIDAWASHLDFTIEKIFDGQERFIKLSKEVHQDDGQTFKSLGTMGQSVCVLTKRAA